MLIRRLSATIALTALVVGALAGPALADKGRGSDDTQSDDRGGDRIRVSQRFQDMSEYEWGLEHVTKLQVKGIFKGREDRLFAPGAKITRQETAVAISRLIDMESEWSLMAAADLLLQLKDLPDAASVAVWAKPAVAGLIKLGVIDAQTAFNPLADATRLDVAVMLVKAMGYEAEAQAKMTAELNFQDAHLIPAELRGYVAAAIDHELITGYLEAGVRTFRPQQAVKRVEMAVMMGRADRQMERRHSDELKGSVTAVSAAAGTVTIALRGGGEATVTMAADASVFVNGVEKSLADVTAGMEIEVKLNATGQVIFVEAKAERSREVTVTGQITSLSAPTVSALGLVQIDGQIYPMARTAAITVNGQAGAFTDLQVNDSVQAVVRQGLVVRLTATRQPAANPDVVIEGTILGLTAASAQGAASVSIGYTAGGTFTMTTYLIQNETTIHLNGQVAAFGSLQANDRVRATLRGDLLLKLEVTR